MTCYVTHRRNAPSRLISSYSRSSNVTGAEPFRVPRLGSQLTRMKLGRAGAYVNVRIHLYRDGSGGGATRYTTQVCGQTVDGNENAPRVNVRREMTPSIVEVTVVEGETDCLIEANLQLKVLREDPMESRSSHLNTLVLLSRSRLIARTLYERRINAFQSVTSHKPEGCRPRCCVPFGTDPPFPRYANNVVRRPSPVIRPMSRCRSQTACVISLVPVARLVGKSLGRLLSVIHRGV
ncbi:hypothetical protein EXIGLDRAFT_475127 [Exidia glandulosa HHB12029]|uniref:Uncharacterized protein n=1 Tax=Exidia glandulosa HHB12029 TaxID=1314781 RepID=A0A165JWU9_EXIGL|nr:hypothetical protein EXIGLDRAFT_475127 [Exidia glandulosa HHB12029]